MESQESYLESTQQNENRNLIQKEDLEPRNLNSCEFGMQRTFFKKKLDINNDPNGNSFLSGLSDKLVQMHQELMSKLLKTSLKHDESLLVNKHRKYDLSTSATFSFDKTPAIISPRYTCKIADINDLEINYEEFKEKEETSKKRLLLRNIFQISNIDQMELKKVTQEDKLGKI